MAKLPKPSFSSPLPESSGNSIIRRLRNHFLAGLLVLIPVLVTFWVAYGVFSFVDSLGKDIFPPLIKGILWMFGLKPEEYQDSVVSTTRGVYALLTLLVIMSVGVLTKSFIVGKIIKKCTYILEHVPAIGSIYRLLHQVLELVLGEQNRGAFQQPVLVDFPDQGIKALAFLTNSKVTGIDFRLLPENQGKTPDTYQAVFMPSTPNPTTGFMMIVPSRRVTFLNMSVEDAIKVILSGGVVTPADLPSVQPIEPEETSDSETQVQP